MNLFKPQLFLARKTGDNETYDYYLYAVTYFDNTGYLADGHEPFSGTPDENGIYHLTLKVAEQEGETLSFISPVVHTVPLGNLSDNGTPFKVETSVYFGEQLVGKSVIDDMEAEDDGKPMM